MLQIRWLEIQARVLMRSWRRYLVPSRILIATSMLALMGGITASFSLPLIWLGLICMTGLVLGLAASSRTLACLWAVLPLLFYTNVVLRIPINNDRSLDGAFVSFDGKVIESQTSAASNRVLVQMQPSGTSAGNTCCMVETRKISLPSVLPGDTIMVQGRLELPKHAFYPWQFDYSQFLRYKGTSYICRAVFVQVVRRGYCYPLLKAFEDARSKLITVQERLMGAQPAQLLISIVLGDRAVSVETKTEDTFRAVGLSHVLAASGFNLSIVVMAARWTMGYAVRRTLWLNLLTIPWIASYDLMAGLSPSILRATLMILLALGVGGLLRRTHGIAVLAACTIICLLLYPGCLQDVGFQLSYLATFGIVSGAKELQQVICGSIKRVVLSKWLGEVISVVLLAQAFVLPVQLSYFWKFSLLFLPANLIVDPLLPPLTILGFVSCLIALFASAGNGLWFLCSCLDRACNLMLQLLLFAVKNLAEHNQAANLCVGPPPVIIATVFLVCLSFFAWGLKTRKHVFLLSMSLLVAAACLLFVRPIKPKLIVANFGTSIVLLNSAGHYMILGNKSCRDADAFARFAGGLQSNDLLPFKIDHHEKFDMLRCSKTQNVLLLDLAALDQKLLTQDDPCPANAAMPKCALVAVYNSSTKAVLHNNRVAAAIYLSHLIACCHISQLLLDAPDSKWLIRSKHFYKDLPDMQIDLPRGGCSIIALSNNGSFNSWTAKNY